MFDVRRSMFDVRVFLPFGSALEVRRWMFDVRVFLPFGEALEVRRWMFAFSSSVRRWKFGVRCSMFAFSSGSVAGGEWTSQLTLLQVPWRRRLLYRMMSSPRWASAACRPIVSGDGTLIALLIFFITLLANRS